MSTALTPSLSAQEKAPRFDYNLCQVQDVPVSMPSPVLNQSILSNLFISSKLKDSWGALSFRNPLHSTIEAIEIILEYQNEEGQSLVQLPYMAATARMKQRFPLLLFPEYTETLKRPLTAGDSTRLYAEGFVIVSRCPSKAKVIALRVMLADGQTQTWTLPGWGTAPVLRYFPRDLELPRETSGRFSHLLVRAQITTQGKIASFQGIDGSMADLPAHLSTAFIDWQFYPAQKDGQPVQGQLVMLLRINTTEAQQRGESELVGTKEVPMPLTVVDLLQDATMPGRWRLWYGRRPGDTFLE